jgi:U3 small nucleolar RNA-associated protein 14
LNAFAIAEQENPTKSGVRQSRLGEIEDEPLSRQDSEVRPTKRRKTLEQASGADEQESGADSEGNDWHLGVEADDNDSELDSDEAMGASDEERFEGFTFRGSNSKQSKRAGLVKKPNSSKDSREIDLGEGPEDGVGAKTSDDSTSEGDMGEGAVDLATAFDMNRHGEEEDHQLAMTRQVTRSRMQGGSEGSDRGSDSSEHETSLISNDEHSALSVSDDEDQLSNHARLQLFVQGLETETDSGAVLRKPRRPVAAGEASDYALTSSQKLTIADLLPTVTDPRLRESLKILHNTEKSAGKPSTSGIPGKLEPPLPKRQQDRLERQAAYEKSKETLSRWIDTVKHNRRAEHISFPLTDPDALAALGTNQLMPVAQSNAVTPLESAIQNIMQESGLASKDDPSEEERVRAFEELQEKKMPIEEVQARRAELRKARDLLFREEVRARRIKKIKSKAYRRVHRKERDRYAQEERTALAAAGVLDSADDRERQDRRRAEERMGSRHKESKWAKVVKATGRATWDEDVRVGVTELARKDDELRKRIEGKEPSRSDASGSETSEDASQDDISVDEYDEAEAARLYEKLGDLGEHGQAAGSGSRLSSMPFMRKAEHARRAANQAEIDQARRMLRGEDDEAEDQSRSLAESGGRRRFGANQQSHTDSLPQATKKNEFEDPLSEDEDDSSAKVEEGSVQIVQNLWPKKATDKQKSVARSLDRQIGGVVLSNDDNPWLSRPRNRKAAPSTEAPVISIKIPLSEPIGQQNGPQQGRAIKKARPVPQTTMQDLTSPSDTDDENAARPTSREQATRRNEELVRMAFAGDDVFQAFSDEKKEVMDEEGDQVVDNSLPGWGSWTGAGISKKEQRRAKARSQTTTTKGVDPSKRKDAKLHRVIINEKRSKKVSPISNICTALADDLL